ncbi:MAG: hypothetical protein H6724_00135 [Sandaracinus sp.]|nr:hypothetical protein [Sandaracinus sp.]MCB9617838.1 hypothetical protein [Sandaracinus sp.]
MCMFTGPIRHVSGTAIFARADEGDRQMLAYQMKVGSDAPVAMVLPLPVSHGASEDALRFVDLSDYDDLFEQMARAVFPVPAARGFGAPQTLTLEVQRVGNFVASFVPSLADFSRLDARFRLAPDVWTALPRYADWGFAVFQLAPEGDQKLHPMAFSFPRRDPSRLFFPTVHVHDGEVHARARFDHKLFYQARRDTPPTRFEPGVPTTMPEWFTSFAPAERFVDTTRTRGVIDPTRHVRGKAMFDELANDDVWVDDPA